MHAIRDCAYAINRIIGPPLEQTGYQMADGIDGDSERGELIACILQIVATDGMYGPGGTRIESLKQRLAGYDDQEIEAVVEEIATVYDWAEYERGELTVDPDAALDEAQDLRWDVYG